MKDELSFNLSIPAALICALTATTVPCGAAELAREFRSDVKIQQQRST